MHQIINFIIKNSNKLLFLLLLGISFVLTFQSHSYHRSKLISSTNSLSGGVYQKVHNWNEYFLLKKDNELLAEENALLKSILYNTPDTTFQSLPSNLNDTQYRVSKAKVIKNSYMSKENILTINAGKKHGVKPFMGVINSKGIIGVTANTSENFTTVISILNIKSVINAKLPKTNHYGTLIWNGKNAGIVQMIDIPRLAEVKQGDSIVTGAQSVFPENIPIGVIKEIYIDKTTNLYTIDVALFNDMTSVNNIYVIENKLREEQLELEESNNE